MRNQFFSLYIILVLTFVSVGWGLDQIFSHVNDDDETVDQLVLYEKLIGLGTERLQASNETSWNEIVNELKTGLGAPLIIENIDEFLLPGDDQQKLMQGNIIYLGDGDEIYFHQRIGNSSNILSLGPVSQKEKIAPLEIILAMVFYSCLALVLFLWFWPLWKNLQILNRTTIEFGRGHFDARAKLPSSSSLSAMAHTFNNMAARIQRLIKSQKEFTNAVSHELRTPIARLRFGIEMLQVAEKLEDRDKQLHGMHSDIDELDNLVDEILTYARLDSDSPELIIRRQDLQPLLRKLLEKMADEYPDILISNNLDELDEAILVEINEQYITRAVENLLRNAIKHTQTEVQLNVYLNKHTIEIHVEDDGAGILPVDRKQIFEPFIRLDSSRNRSSGGSGLGLAIVHRITKWHHGDTWVTDAKLGGARFCISLPIVFEVS